MIRQKTPLSPQTYGRWKLRGTFEISYVDGWGERTTRCIRANQIEGDREFRLWAFCETRKALHPFVVERIERLTDMETGIIVDGRAIAAWLVARAAGDGETHVA